MKFSEIKSTKQLISYLNASARQQKSFFHYTTLSKLESIKRSKCFYLSSFIETNDMYEADSIDSDVKKNTFIACFSRNESESVAMWYMYATPHDEGIRIEIKPEIMKKWINELQKDKLAMIVNGPNKNDKTVKIDKVRIHTIAYFEPVKNKFYWSNVQLFCRDNIGLQEFNSDINTHGYVKHAAWEYEEEMRLSVKVDKNSGVKKISIPVPDYVIKNLIIMTGPNFKKDVAIKDDYQQSILFEKVSFKK